MLLSARVLILSHQWIGSRERRVITFQYLFVDGGKYSLGLFRVAKHINRREVVIISFFLQKLVAAR